MLRIRGLSVEVPGFELRDVDLEVERGEFFAVIGPTGSGKSLLIEAVTGLLPSNLKAFRGSITWNGRELTCLPPHRRGIGILYQDAGLFPHMTVEQNISYGLRYRGIRGDEASRRCISMARRLGIDHLMGRYPQRISGGERQRVALARVLVLNPEVVLLDEPLSAIDPLFQEEIRGLLRRIHQEFGITFVMVSHNFDEVMHLAGSGAVMRHGRIVQKARIEEIFDRPSSSFVARFVGAHNVFRAEVVGRLVRVGPVPVVLTDEAFRDDFDHIVVRPERIVPVDVQGHPPLDNSYTGTVVELSRRSFSVCVSIDTEGVIFRAVWPEHIAASMNLKVGSRVGFGFSKAHVGTFKEDGGEVRPCARSSSCR